MQGSSLNGKEEENFSLSTIGKNSKKGGARGKKGPKQSEVLCM